MKKRLLALCLAAALLLGMMPALTLPARAAELTNGTVDIFNNVVKDSTDTSFVRFARPATKWYKTQDIGIDHSKTTTINLEIQTNSPGHDRVLGALDVNDSNGLGGSELQRIIVKDYESKSFFYAYLCNSEDNVLQIGVLDANKQNVYVSLGVASESAVMKLSLRWNTDGSVTVYNNGIKKGTVPNATWTVDETKNVGRAQNPNPTMSYNDGVCESDFISIYHGFSAAKQTYMYNMSITYAEPVEPTNGAIDILNNVTRDSTDKNSVRMYNNDGYWYKSADIAFSREKDITYTMPWMFNSTGMPATKGSLEVDASGNLVSTNVIRYILKDDETDTFIYAYITTDTDGKLYAGILDANKENQYIPLGVDAVSGDIIFGLKWKADGSVVILKNDKEMGEFANATWTADWTAAVGSAANPTPLMNDTTCYGDFVSVVNTVYSANSRSAYLGYIYPSKGDTTIIHTTPPAPPAPPATPELNAYVTAEALTDNDTLSEYSWKYAPSVDLNGIKASVLMNQGDAYVALKGTGSVEVKLGDADPQNVTFVDGAAKVVFENAVDAFDAVVELTVAGVKANVTFVAKLVKQDGTGTPALLDIMKGAHDIGRWPNYDPGMTRFNWSSYAGTWYMTAAQNEALVLDHSGVNFLELKISDDGSMTSALGALSIDANGKVVGTNALIFVAKDYETASFYYAYITTDNNGMVKVGFLKPDGTTNVYVDLGITSADFELELMGFRWYPNGDVEVSMDGDVKRTVEDVTWKVNESADAGTAYNPSADGTTTATEADFLRMWWSTRESANTIMYLYGSSTYPSYVTNIPALEDVAELDMEAAVADAIGDTSAVTKLPAAVVDPSWGATALTWTSNVEGLVVGNKLVRQAADVENVTLTAAANGKPVWTDTVTVKGIDPVYGVFTTNANASWNLVPFVSMHDLVDSVAVLATNNDTVHVAVKTLGTSATVTLGEAVQNIDIENGMGFATFTGVNLEKYGETRALSVETDSDHITTTVYFNANQTTNSIAMDLINNSNFADNTSGIYQGNASETFLRMQKAGAGFSKKGTYGDLVIDRSMNVKINLNMQFQEGYFTAVEDKLFNDTRNAVDATYKNNVRFTFKDYETHSFIYPYFTADEYQNIQLGFFLNDAVSNEYVDLGISVAADDNDGTYTVSLEDLYLVWNTDGSVTVMLGDEVKGTVQNATWTVGTLNIGNINNRSRSGNPVYEGGYEATTREDEFDFVLIQTAYAGNSLGYIYGISFSYETPVAIVDIEQNKTIDVTADLGSDIGFNLYIAENPNATITVSGIGKEDIHYGSELSVFASGEHVGKYLVEFNLAASQMTENVNITIVDIYGFTLYENDISVKAYVEAIENPDETTVALIEKMLNYGGAAQKYFGNTDNLASNNPPSDDLLDIEDTSYTAEKSENLADIMVKSATLSLEDRVIIRYFFTVTAENGIADYTFMCNGSDLTPQPRSENVWYVDVAVNPQNMDVPYTINVTSSVAEGELTVTYSCMTYMVKYDTSETENLPELLMAMYDYMVAAQEYKAAHA